MQNAGGQKEDVLWNRKWFSDSERWHEIIHRWDSHDQKDKQCCQ